MTSVEHNVKMMGGNIADPEYRHLIENVGIMAALAAWRVTQGVYRFDQDIYKDVVETPITGNIPHEILYQLPEWCVYIETPGLSFFENTLVGFFAHLEYDTKTGHDELRFVLDCENERKPGDPKKPTYRPNMIHLGDWTLEEAIKKTAEESYRQMEKWGWDTGEVNITSQEFISISVSQFQPLVSLLLYLCSANGEIESVDERVPSKPKPKKTKKGLRLFPPNRPTTWDVGVRMGAAIRKAKIAIESEDRGGTHASPRPHVRRAHWHTYWTGPRKDPQKRKPILKWLSPILVNVEDGADMPVTIRQVKK